MASKKDPSAEIQGTTRVLNSDRTIAPPFRSAHCRSGGRGYWLYSFFYWSGNRDGRRTGNTIEQPTVKPDASPKAPSTR